MDKPSQKPKRKTTAQAMVEFALALPILLLVVYGLLETGRLLFMYASVVTAARQAARYGSASGDNGSGTNYYNDCTGIQAAAKRVAFIQSFSKISISYDNGPGASPAWTQSGCPIASSSHPNNGDRITVSVESVFSPIVPLVPLSQFTIKSTDSRTLLIAAHIEVTPGTQGFTGSTALLLGKSANPTTYDHAGQVITYTYTIQNTGTSAIAGPFTITDDKIGSFTCGGAPSALAGGGSVVTCNNPQQYTITDADLTAGTVTNTAYALSADSTASNYVSVTVKFTAVPHIILTKTGTAPAVIDAGQQIQYTFVITNDGNAPLTPPYTISDPLIGSNWTCPSTPNPLPPSGTVTCTGTYTLKNNDIGGTTIDNTARASAHYGSQTITSAPASASVLIPELLLQLSVNPASVSWAFGQPYPSVTYTYKFTNRTTSTINNINVTDTRGANGLACVATVASGASGTCTHTYTVTQADLDQVLGYFANTATGTGTAKKSITSNVAGVNVTIAQTPTLTLTKTAAPVLNGAGQSFGTGQLITYSYAIKNTGNVTISPTVALPMKVTDSDPRVIMAPACNVTSGSLAPNATQTCTGTLSLQDPDIAAGSVTSTGTVNAYFGSTSIQASSTYTLVTFYNARLSLVKTSDKSYFTKTGDQITYYYSVKNTGGQPLTITALYALTDNVIGAIACPLASVGKQLQLGASIPCTPKPYPITDADMTAGKVTNVVTATAGATNPATTAGSATLTVTKLTCDSSHPDTSPSGMPIQSGANAQWTINNNTGTTLHIASMTVSWGGGNLTQILLGGQSVWSGSAAPNGILSITTTGWPALPFSGGSTNTIMNLKFSGAQGTNIKVTLTFQENVGGNQCQISSP